MYILVATAVVISAMSSHDMEFDETRGGPRDGNNFLSVPTDGALYLATKNVLPWRQCGAHDVNRSVVPTYEVAPRQWGAFGTQPRDNENNADELHSRAALYWWTGRRA